MDLIAHYHVTYWLQWFETMINGAIIPPQYPVCNESIRGTVSLLPLQIPIQFFILLKQQKAGQGPAGNEVLLVLWSERLGVRQ